MLTDTNIYKIWQTHLWRHKSDSRWIWKKWKVHKYALTMCDDSPETSTICDVHMPTQCLANELNHAPNYCFFSWNTFQVGILLETLPSVSSRSREETVWNCMKLYETVNNRRIMKVYKIPIWRGQSSRHAGLAAWGWEGIAAEAFWSGICRALMPAAVEGHRPFCRAELNNWRNVQSQHARRSPQNPHKTPSKVAITTKPDTLDLMQAKICNGRWCM